MHTGTYVFAQIVQFLPTKLRINNEDDKITEKAMNDIRPQWGSKQRKSLSVII